MWYQKYCPETLDDYVWPEANARETLEHWIADPMACPHLILYGPPGTGKTSITQILANMLPTDGEILTIPASLERKIDEIVDKIVQFCESGGFGQMKLVILDEADRLTKTAQDSLRNIMDMYAGDVRFIITCNNFDALADAVKSRNWSLEITAHKEDDFARHLLGILEAEKVSLDGPSSTEAFETIIHDYYPNMRLAISEFQRCSLTGVLKLPSELLDLSELPKLKQMAEIDAYVKKLPLSSYTAAYRSLYDNIHAFTQRPLESNIILIAQYMAKHPTSICPDINLIALMAELHTPE